MNKLKAKKKQKKKKTKTKTNQMLKFQILLSHNNKR